MAKLTHTVSGNNITSFRSADIANIESLKCHFLPVQEGSGDPSPENVRPISGWNGIQIQHINKNFIKKYYTTSAEKKGLTIIPTEKGIHISGTATARTACMLSDTNHIPFKTNDKVTFSLYLNGDISQCENPYVGYYKKVGVYGNATGSLRTDNNYTFTWTVPSAYGDTNESYIDSYIYIPQGVTVDFEIGLQAELASVMSEFEPHKESIIPITFPTIGKNKLNPADVFLYDGHFTVNNGVYTSTITDTRTWTQLTVQLWKTKGSYLKTLYVDYVQTIGKHTLTFTVDDPRGQYICFKHNGIKKDFIILFPVPLGMRQYTISCNLISNDPTTVGGVQFSDLQLEVGDTATEYEPYVDNLNNTIYGGYVDIAKGEIVAEFVNKIYTGDLSEEWKRESLGNGTNFYIMTPEIWKRQTDSQDLYCNIAKSQSANIPLDVGTTKITATGNLNVYIGPLLNMTSTQEFCNWLTTHNLQIICKLKEPIHYSLSKTELKTFLDQNNIWSNTNDITEVTYNIIDHLVQKRMNIPKTCRKVLWNQLCPPLDADNWKDYSTTNLTSTTFNNGIATHEYLVDNKGLYSVSICQKIIPIVQENHIYYASYMISPDHQMRYGLEFANNQYATNKYTVQAGEWQRCSFIAQCATTGYGNLYIPNVNPQDVYAGYKDQIKSPIYIDLTQMFGAGQEPTLDTFEQLCALNHIDLTQYHEQNTGTEQIWYTNGNDTNIYQTVEWNQLARKLNLSNYIYFDAENTLTASENPDELTIQYNVLWTDYHNCIKDKDSGRPLYYKNHIYYAAYEFCPSWNCTTIGLSICNYASPYYPTAPANEYTRMSYILEKTTDNGRHGVLLAYPMNQRDASIGDTVKCRNVVVVDLTQMFGAGNEPTTAIEFENICQMNNIDITKYQPVNAGTKQLWRIK